MTIVRVPAREILDVEAEKVSLVKHGATRRPFKVLKADDPAHAGSTPPGIMDTLRNLFTGPEEAPKVLALFVKSDRAKALFPVAKKHGFRVEKDHASIDGDVVVLKQEGFADIADVKTVVAISPDMAVGLSRVVKDFDCWHSGIDFDENIRNQSFYPCVRMATDTFHETLWAVMAESHTQEEAASRIDALTKQFSTYVKGLLKSLPTTVFKMEADLLPPQVGGNTVASATNTNTAGEQAMSNTNKPREVMKGDLDGLFNDNPAVVKADDAASAGAGDANANAAATTAATTAGADAAANAGADTAAAAAGADAAAAGTTDATAADAAVAGAEAAAPATTPADAAATAVAAATPAATVAKSELQQVLEGITNLTATVVGFGERLSAVEKTAQGAETVAKAAVAKADNTVVVADSGDLDISLATLGSTARPVRKSDSNQHASQGDNDGNVWAGLLPELDSFAGE